MNIGTISSKVKCFGGMAAAYMTVASSQVTTVFASSSSDLLSSEATAKSENIIIKICSIYRKWSIPFIILTAILYFVTKDDKRKEMEKKALIGMLIVYVLTYFVDFLAPTLDTIGNGT